MTVSIKQSSYLTATELTVVTTLSATTIWRKCKSKDFPAPLYLGNKKLWKREDVDKWLADNLTATPTHNNLAKEG